MQALVSSNTQEESKVVGAVVGRDVASMVQSYLPALVDIAFLKAVLPYFTVNDEFGDLKAGEKIRSFDLYQSRGYDIKDEKGFLSMLKEYPITNATNRLILLVKDVSEEEKEIDYKENITLQYSRDRLYTLRNWTEEKKQPQNDKIYIRDIFACINFLVSSLWEETSGEGSTYLNHIVDRLDVADVEYHINDVDGAVLVIKIDMSTIPNR